MVVASAVAAAVPLLRPPEYALSFLYFTFLYSAMAVGWTILGGFTGYLSFGHVAFLGIGGYTAALASLTLLPSAGLGPPASLALLMLLGGVVAAAVALVVGAPLLRLRGPYFTVGSLLFVKVLAVLVLNTPFLGGGAGLWLPMPPLDITGLRRLVYFATLGLAGLAVLVAWRIQHSKVGLGLRAIREDEDVAAGLAVDTLRLKLIALCASAAITGMAGAVYAFERGNIYVETMFDLNISVLVVLSALLGGAGHWAGPLLGASLVRILDEFLGVYVGKETARVLFGLMLALVMLFRPKGMLVPATAVGWTRNLKPSAKETQDVAAT